MILLKGITPILLICSMLATGLRPFSPVPLASMKATVTAARIKWIVLKTSSISINGRTNVNSFCCEVNSYAGPDTLSAAGPSLSADLQGIPLKGALQIAIGDFDCRNKAMTAEFKKTLKYREFPQLRIVFRSLDKLPAFNNNGEIIKGWVDVLLAGREKRFEIAYTSFRNAAGELQLVGSRVFGFSDFGLQPPRKLGGLIRVNDTLNVQFRLCLQAS